MLRILQLPRPLFLKSSKGILVEARAFIAFITLQPIKIYATSSIVFCFTAIDSKLTQWNQTEAYGKQIIT